MLITMNVRTINDQLFAVFVTEVVRGEGGEQVSHLWISSDNVGFHCIQQVLQVWYTCFWMYELLGTARREIGDNGGFIDSFVAIYMNAEGEHFVNLPDHQPHTAAK